MPEKPLDEGVLSVPVTPDMIDIPEQRKRYIEEGGVIKLRLSVLNNDLLQEIFSRLSEGENLEVPLFPEKGASPFDVVVKPRHLMLAIQASCDAVNATTQKNDLSIAVASRIKNMRQETTSLKGYKRSREFR